MSQLLVSEMGISGLPLLVFCKPVFFKKEIRDRFISTITRTTPLSVSCYEIYK